MAPLSIGEVVIRNAVDDALQAAHGARWPWAPSFFYSLSSQGRPILIEARRGHSTTGSVIAELSFGFWENMFKASHDAALWNLHLFRVFPGLPGSMTVQQARAHIRGELKKIRNLRNRIAHHEPLLATAVLTHLQSLHDLVRLRCADTAAWLIQAHDFSQILADRPRG